MENDKILRYFEEKTGLVENRPLPGSNQLKMERPLESSITEI